MIEIPKLLRARPKYNGMVVPFFVSWYRDGKMVDERTPEAVPDFRVTDMHRAAICRRVGVCWICGKKLGSYKWFVFGPSSALDRTSAEPPSHKDCAHYAVRVCPYMLHPGMSMAPKVDLLPSQHIYEEVETNHPEVIVLWATKGYISMPVDPSRGFFYYKVAEPDVVEFWYAGRRATRAEINRAIDLVFENNPNVKRTDIRAAWAIEHLLRFAPSEEENVKT